MAFDGYGVQIASFIDRSPAAPPFGTVGFVAAVEEATASRKAHVRRTNAGR